MQEASSYNKLDNKEVQCLLCPRNCTVTEGHFGECHARKNRHGILYSEVYGKISSLNTDPIEKKPLYHFHPGSQIVSIGTTGCNLHCQFCQNHVLSQCDVRKPVLNKNFDEEEMVTFAKQTPNNLGIAFTYNEPSINYEYVMAVARLLNQQDLKSVFISNGYISSTPLAMLCKYIDAFNIDLKGFSNSFYTKYTKANLSPVLNSIKQISQSGKHLEITNLVIPAYNDDKEKFEKMCIWIKNETGANTVLHLSRYFPRFKLKQYPTPPETLFTLYDIAKSHLNHVYLSNMATEIHSNTYCSACSNTLIERTYYHIRLTGINEDGTCKECGSKQLDHLQ